MYTIMVASPTHDDQGGYNGAVAFVVDVTDRRLLEEKLLQSQKMEVVGQLADGIAHDFNNLLTAILGYAVYAMTSVRKDDPVHEYLGEIQAAAERAAELTRQLLTFARRDIIDPRIVSFNDSVLEITGMLHRLIGENIELVTSLPQDLGTVKADPGHLGQVIVNMVVNARDAMPEGGTLSIETANFALSADDVRRMGDIVRLVREAFNQRHRNWDA
jgi:two-component system cell cycle sensor histidine kinase/response regulator CckA